MGRLISTLSRVPVISGPAPAIQTPLFTWPVSRTPSGGSARDLGAAFLPVPDLPPDPRPVERMRTTRLFSNSRRTGDPRASTAIFYSSARSRAPLVIPGERAGTVWPRYRPACISYKRNPPALFQGRLPSGHRSAVRNRITVRAASRDRGDLFDCAIRGPRARRDEQILGPRD